MKWCGKSAPRLWQQRRQGKPHREQDQIGTARRLFPDRRPGRSREALRQRTSQRNGHPSLRRGQNPAYRPSDAMTNNLNMLGDFSPLYPMTIPRTWWMLVDNSGTGPYRLAPPMSPRPMALTAQNAPGVSLLEPLEGDSRARCGRGAWAFYSFISVPHGDGRKRPRIANRNCSLHEFHEC